MTGPAVHIHAPVLQGQRGLTLAHDSLSALQCLQHAGLLPGSEGGAA